MKKFRKVYAVFFIFLLYSGCVSNPLSGKKTMAFIGNDELFAMSFTEYSDFLNENKVITGTADAEMIKRVGVKLAGAAQKWLVSEGQPNYLDDYKWEYNLVQDDQINAWCMPGGKIVFYTGILPITRDETGVAIVMGHEIAHALLNHGQQRMSAGVLQQLGAVGVAVLTGGASENTQALAMLAYGIGSNYAGMLPFSRDHENEADEYGLYLMAIAGYDPDQAAPLWERMAALGGSGPEWLSTHPSSENRIKHLRELSPKAKQVAARLK